MVKLAIIADDLTGACDSGIKLKNLGCATTVIVDFDRCGGLPQGGECVVSVNTNTRSASCEEGVSEVSRIVSELKRSGVSCFYKKVDSVLRGNTGSETEACRAQCGADFALIAPEYPDNGRTIENGILHISNACGASVTADALAAIAATVAAEKCACVFLHDVRGGRQTLIDSIEKLVSDGATIIVADAVTGDDMKALAEAAAHFGPRCLPAGSAGWLPYLYENKRVTQQTCASIDAMGDKHVIVCVGSRHPATLAQVKALRASDLCSAYLLEMTDEKHIDINAEVSRLIARLKDDLANGQVKQCILVTTGYIYEGIEDDGLQLMTKNTDNKEVVAALAEAVGGIFELLPVGGLILTGGDTADGVLERLDCGRLELVAEPMSGIVSGLAVCDGEQLAVATKSGGFGDDHALDGLYDYLLAGDCSSVRS